MKKYLIFDLDGTLIESMGNTVTLILDHLEKIPQTDIQKAQYIFKTTAGLPLKKQLEMIYEGDHIDTTSLMMDLYEKINNLHQKFFPGVPEKITELKDQYQLFLTTGNSTQTAKKHLEKAGILPYFEIVFGSDKIGKGEVHLEYFQQYTADRDFYKKAVYIGDGDADRFFAAQKEIDFIHIGNDKKDRYEIPSVSQIDMLLELLNNQ